MHGVTESAVEEAIRAYVKLMRASRSVANRVEPLVGAEGLTLTQLGVLEGILHKGPLTHRELGRKVLTSAGNMTDVVDKLEGVATDGSDRPTDPIGISSIEFSES